MWKNLLITWLDSTESLLSRLFFSAGLYNGIIIDNTTPAEINAWLKAIERIRPSEVMIYTISRDTPEGGQLNKVPVKRTQENSCTG